MSELCLSRGIEVGGMPLDVAVDYGGYKGGGEVGMIAIIGSRYKIDKGRKVGRQNRIGWNKS